MDSLNGLKKQNNAPQVLNVNQAIVETEEERQQRIFEAERIEADKRKQAFAADEKYIVMQRLNKMSENISASTASRRVNEMLKIIEGILKGSDNYIFVSNQEMARRVLSIINVYEAEIKAIAPGDSRNLTIERYRTKCKNSIAQNGVSNRTKQRDESIDSLSEGIMSDAEEEETESLDASIDNTLSAKTMEGVRNIDRWMLRHMHEAGMSENDKFAFVSALLKLPARERLYMYFVIEKGHRHKPMTSDVIESQLSYVPDKDRFTKQMKMSKARIFRRMANGSIYWNKLADVYGQLEYVRPTINKYSKIDQNGTNRTAERRDNIVRAYIEANGGENNAKKKREITDEIYKRNRLLKARDNALLELRDALIDFKQKKKISDSAWVNKAKKKSAADRAAAEVHNKLQRLLDKDSQIGVIEKNLRNGNADNINDHVTDASGEAIDEEGFDRLGDFAEVGERVVDNIGSPATAAYDTISEMAESALEADTQFLGINNTHLAHMSIANVSALSVLAISGAINAISSFIELKKNASGMMKGDFVAAGADLFSQVAAVFESGFSAYKLGAETLGTLSAATETATKVAEEIKDAAEEMVEAAGETLSNADKIVKFAGIGTASLGLLANTAIMINSAVNSSYLNKSGNKLSQKRLNEQNNRGNNPESEEDRKNRLRKEKYEDLMIRHQQRVLKEEKIRATVDIVNNAALLGSAFSAGLLTPVLSGVSVGMSLYSTIRASITNRREKTATIDEYLGIAGYDNENLKKAFQNYVETSKLSNQRGMVRDKYATMNEAQKENFKKKSMDKLRIGIRNEIMAKMGCATKADLYNKIMEKYGNIIYDGAFKVGDAEITDPDDLNAPERIPYVKLINSLGLKVRVTNNGIKPTKDAIISKLIG